MKTTLRSLAILLCLLTIPAFSEAQVLTVRGFGGEVLDTIEGTTKSGFTGGLAVNYRITDAIGLNLSTYHSKRRAEDSLSEIIFDADSFEWKAGLSYDVKSLNEGQTALCLVGEGGFVQLLDTPGDVRDDHFLGVGIDHRGGSFSGSMIQFGYGKSDVFGERRNSRFKSRALLRYNPENLPMGLGMFVRGDLDSDLRDGRDGTRVILGAFIPVEQLFQ